MKKIVVRIFNILFIGLAAFACFCFATKPLFSLEVSATIRKEAVGDLAESFLQSDEESDTDEGGDSTYIVRTMTRDGSDDSSEFDIKSALSSAKIAEAVGDITLTIPLKIEAKQCFDLDNKKVFNEIIENNIGPVVDNTVEILSPKFKNLVKTVTLDFAKDVMKEQVANQVRENFKEDIPIDEEKIDQLVDSIYGKLDKGEGETTTISELSNAIIGEKTYVKAEGVTSENFGEKTYYVKAGEEYVKAEEFADGVEYYVEDYNDGVRGILQDIQKQQAAEGKEVTEIDFDEIDMTQIESQMGDALDSIPNLTQHPLADPQPTAETFALAKYYVKTDLGGYEVAKEFKESETYYTDEVLINNIDDALIGLLDLLVGDKNEEPVQQEEPTPAIMRAHLQKADEEQSDRIGDKVKSIVYKLIPFDDLMNQDMSLGGYAPMILFVLVLLGIVPWALFILLTLIRTLHKRKCWTKTWIIIVFAFTQVIFGIGLTLGLKYAMPRINGLLDGVKVSLGEGGGEKALTEVITGLNISLQTSAYIPSIIYIAFIPLTIIYMIIRHSVKRDFKQYKKDKKAARHAPKAA